LYTELIKDYDRKTKELIMENTDLRSFINSVHSDLSKSVTKNNKTDDSYYESEASLSNENIETSDLTEQILKLPFENIQEKLTKDFKSKFDLIKENSNLTISSINSIATKTNDLLNTTITIETNDRNDEYLNETPFNSSSKYSNIDNIDDSHKSFSTCSQIQSIQTPNDLIENEILFLNEEKAKLAKEKKLFFEQKLKLEKDSIIFRKLTNELNYSKKEFEKEQENFYESKLFSLKK
jgi:hypothetical protein